MHDVIQAITEHTRAVRQQTEWLKEHHDCATRKDLRKAVETILSAIVADEQSPRYIRLQVAAVNFVQPGKDTKPMAENLGIDVPAGLIARIPFKPVDEKLKPAKLDGPIEAKVLDDPTAPTQPPAEVAVGGAGGLTLDIKLPDAEGSLASVEVSGDNDLAPDTREVITTLITLRRLGDVPGKAVSLGATASSVSFPTADQFGVFPA